MARCWFAWFADGVIACVASRWTRRCCALVFACRYGRPETIFTLKCSHELLLRRIAVFRVWRVVGLPGLLMVSLLVWHHVGPVDAVRLCLRAGMVVPRR